MMAEYDHIENVIQGDFTISDDHNTILIIRYCIAVCLTDTVRGIGGMNHFLLPHGSSGNGENVRYGAYAMELLINGLLKQGADRTRLKAKVFGGAKMIGKLRDIGRDNADFAMSFLSDETIPCIAHSTGGNQARRVRFWPTTGRAKQLLVQNAVVPPPPTHKLPSRRPAGQDITLF